MRPPWGRPDPLHMGASNSLTDSELWRVLLQVAREDESTGLAISVPHGEVSRVAAAIVEHKLSLAALRRLQHAQPGSPEAQLKDELNRRVKPMMAIFDGVAPIRRQVLRLASEFGGGVMKGWCVRRYYPDPEVRLTRDLDIHFASLERAVPFVARLRERGWEWDSNELPWVKWDDNRKMYGQMNLVLRVRGSLVSRVDVHVGPYSVGYGGVMPLSGFEEAEVEGVRIQCTDRATSVEVMAAHSAAAGWTSLTDVNDLWFLSRGSVGWASVIKVCSEAGAGAVLSQLSEVAGMLYTTQVMTVTLPGVRVPWTPPTGWQRSIHAARLTWAQEGRHHLGARLVRAVGAFRYYSADLRPGTVRPVTPSPSTEAVRTRFNCWRLVPAPVWPEDIAHPVEHANEFGEEALSREVAIVARGHGTAVRLGHDVFIPTLWGPITRASLDLGRELNARGND